MIISKSRISIKSLSAADLGWSKKSNQTHIGLPANFIHNWKNHLGIDGYLSIKDYGSERVTVYTKPITRQNGDIDAPSIKTTPPPGVNVGKFPSARKRIKKASEKISQKLKSDKILMIVCFNEAEQIIIILLELENNVLANIRNHTNLVNRNNNISAKVLFKDDDNFNYIRQLAQFYTEIIETGLTPEENKLLNEEGVFEFKNLQDARKKIKRSIVIRQGQTNFRDKLLDNYGYKCCATLNDVKQSLEACHIFPYMGPKTNHPTNGLIFRSDLHSLYDQNLLTIDKFYKIRLSEQLKISDHYKFLEGKKINLPESQNNWPSKKSIEFKMKEFKD